MLNNNNNKIYIFAKLQYVHFIVSQTKPNRSEIRVPTSVWSGYGFSQSSPSAMLKGQRDVNFFFVVTIINNIKSVTLLFLYL